MMQSISPALPPVLCLFITSALALPVSAQTAATEKLRAPEFIEACKTFLAEGSASARGVLCKAYLEGYLAGTDKVIDEEQLPSPFMLRALRTRVPEQSAKTDATLRGPYCLPNGKTVRPLIEKIAAMTDQFATTDTPDSVIDTVLKKHYPCER